MSASPSLLPVLSGVRIKLKRKREILGLHQGTPEEDDPTLDKMQDNEDSPKSSSAFYSIPLSEVLPGKVEKISVFPVAVKQKVGRPHSSVLAVVAAERSILSTDPADDKSNSHTIFLENISHGQFQSLSRIPADNPGLVPADQEKPESPAFVCTPPNIREGRGVLRQFLVASRGHELLHVLPTHADWFCSTKIHRMEKQVLSKYFAGKTSDYTPEIYMAIRNKIIAKYLEHPEKGLMASDCQGLVDVGIPELSRMVRFLDQWGIINYLAEGDHKSVCSTPTGATTLHEDHNGEIHIPFDYLRAIDSLIHFEKPRSWLREENISSLTAGSSEPMPDLDKRIRERLSQSRCHHCMRPCSHIYYQSHKEADAILCSDCFHDGRFVVGHSSIDFLRTDAMKDSNDLDNDIWTDQETLLLLEALEIYNDNWNEIAEHVGTKSKAQCILQFVRLPMDASLLENIELPATLFSSHVANQRTASNFVIANGDPADSRHEEIKSEDQLPFAESSNTIMSLVSFLAYAIGPRIAAAFAHGALAILSKAGNGSLFADAPSQLECSSEGDRANSQSMHHDDVQGSFGHHKEETKLEGNESGEPLSREVVKVAAKSGLSAAAMKAKLFADHEECDIQRMSATIINHQLKRIELKLKQIGEIETLLLKECDQVDRARQRISADRARILSSRFSGSVPSTLPMASGVPTMASGVPTVSSRPTMPVSGPQSAVPAFSHQINHPAMAFMPRQQQMFAFGPRVPLSALHPPPSAPVSPMMVTMRQDPGVSHSMLGPVSTSNQM